MSMALWIVGGIVSVIVIGCVVFTIVNVVGARRFEKWWSKMTPDEQRQWQYDHAGDTTRFG